MSDTAPRQVTAYESTKQTLVAMQGQIAAQLPASIKPEKFIGAVLVAVKLNPDLLNADKTTFYGACLKCAQDGLLPDGREAALVMFGKTVQYMPMAYGIIKKVYNAGTIKKLSVHVVYENDDFDYELGDNERISHRPKLGDRGKPMAAYAIGWLNDGTMLSPEVMSFDEIESVRAVSRAKNSGTWTTWWGEMARKTVLRRFLKRQDQSPEDLQRVLDHDNENYDLNQPAQEKPPTAPLARLKKAIGVEVPKEPEPESTGGDLPDIPEDMKEVMK